MLARFGASCLALGALLAVLIPFHGGEVNAYDALYKPIKFCLSTAAAAWGFGWLLHELRRPKLVRAYSWLSVAILGAELAYITAMGLRGVDSHFNTADWWGPYAFTAMGMLITVYTLATLLVGGLSWPSPKRIDIDRAYLAGIRWAVPLFVLFAFAGGAIAANGGHVVGADDTARGLPFLGWAIDHGDLRIAHFFGMHALQILPLLGAYVLRRRWQVHLAGLAYLTLACGIFAWAMAGRGLLG